LLHVALPDSSINLKRAEAKPGTFADTGIPAILADMKKLGVTGRKDLVVKLAGGASIMDSNNIFNIGKRNLLAVRKILWKYGLGPVSEDVSGKISRSVTMSITDGKVIIASPGRGEWEI
jgi:chemotaxis protein CheD